MTNLLDDDYKPPFKPKKGRVQFDILCRTCGEKGHDAWGTIGGWSMCAPKALEELDRPVVTEDFEDSPHTDRLPKKEEGL